MSIDFSSDRSGLLSSHGSQVKKCADDFERQWKSGNSPRIEDFVQRASPEIQQPLFRELLSRELRLSEQPNDLAALLSRFPNDRSIVNDVFYETRGSAAGSGNTVKNVIEPLSTTNRYTDLRLYRVGGMANLYMAHDQDLRRDTIIKQLRDEFRSDPSYAGQLEIEAEITCLLDHPGIVPVFGVGRWGEDPFYVMSVIKGGDLLPAIAGLHTGAGGAFNHQTRAKRDQLFHLLEHLCSACKTLAYAHDQGVVHCDVKPLNIMIGEYGETFVIDWGLARTFRSATQFSISSDSKWKTRVSTAKGMSGFTPGYVSPEQHFGNGQLGPACDIYSLGATLYHILTNRAQLQGSEPDFADRLASGRITPPREINRKIPKGLEAICLKAMHVSPDERYHTAMEMAVDLQNWMRDDEITALREGWSDWLFRRLRRHRSATVAIAFTSVVLLIAGVLMESSARHARGQRETDARHAREQRETDARHTREANVLREKAETRFKAALKTFEDLSQPLKNGDKSRLDIILPMATDIWQFADAVLDDVAALKPDPEQLAQVYELRATANAVLETDINLQLVDLRKAEQQYSECLTLHDDQPGIGTRLACNQLAQARLQIGRREFNEATALLKSAISQFRNGQKQSVESKDTLNLKRYEADARHEMGRAYHGVARSSGRKSDVQTAEDQYNASLMLRKELKLDVPGASEAERDNVDRGLARSYAVLGNLHLESGDVVEALRNYGESIRLRENLYKMHPRDAEACLQYARGLANFAKVELVRDEDLKNAIAKLETATAVQHSLVNDFPNMLEFTSDLAVALLQLAELRLAAAFHSEMSTNVTKEERFKGASEAAEKVVVLLTKNESAAFSDPTTVVALGSAKLLLAEMSIETNPNTANRFATQALEHFMGLRKETLGHGEYFKLALARAILNRPEEAMLDLDIAVEKGCNTVQQFLIHRNLGFRKTLESESCRAKFDGLIKVMRDRQK